MSDDKNKGTNPPSEPSEEEKKQEEEALKEAKEDEIREEVIKNFSLDKEYDKDLIDKIVKDKLEGKKALSTAIRQKIERRKEAQELQKKLGPEKKDETPEGGEEDKPLTKGDLEEREMKRDLEALEVSDELKQEIESFARFKRVSVKEALKAPHIQHLKEAEDKKRREEEAGAGGPRRTRTEGGKPTKDDFQHGDFDLKTEEGRKAYEDWKREQGLPA